MARLIEHAYGKSSVRFTRVVRHADRHELIEASVDTQLTGDFDETYLEGDNRRVVATDSMKNTVYVHAAIDPWPGVDMFADRLASHYVATYPQVRQATVRIQQARWNRLLVADVRHAHAFESAGSEVRTCRISATCAGIERHHGLDRLVLLKTTDSAFRDFVRDQYTTLPDSDDRIFATTLNAEWRHDGGCAGNEADFEAIRRSLVESFARHMSLSVQHTIHAMGHAVLGDHPAVSWIGITMPNQHRIPFNLSPLGLPNNNDVFVTTSEPYGLISGSLARS